MSLTAQQSVSDIAKLLKSYERMMQQYDAGADSVYLSINQQIKEQGNNIVNQAIWQCCQAQFLSQYFADYRWTVMNRTPLPENEIPEDFKIWDAKTITKQIIYHYLKSLENEELIKYDITDFQELLFINSDTNFRHSSEYRPTLYDFLAFRLMDGLNLYGFESLVSNFSYKNEYFSDNQDFINLNISSENPYCTEYIELKTLQNLTRLHSQDKNPKALIYITLYRYRWLKENFGKSELSNTYLEALLHLEKQFANQKGYEQIAFELGEYYEERAREYDKTTHPEYANDYVTAISWYEKAIQAAPQSIEANNAHYQIEEIKAPYLSFDISCLLLPDQPNLVNIVFKNCDTAHLLMYAISEKEYNVRFDNKIDEFIAFARKSKPVWQEQLTLTDDGLYRSRTGHYMLPEMKSGYYILVASPSKELSRSHIAFEYLNFSAIDGTYKQNDDQLEILVFDRSSGKPIHKANVNISFNYYDNQRQKELHLQTDVNGKCTVKNPDARFVSASVQYKNSSVKILNYQYINSGKEYKQSFELERIHIFTDREIYRPGQTVYFKGIITEEQRKNSKTKNLQLLGNRTISVKFRDANYQDIGELTLTSNEFGSFAGSFVLPENVLTGRFTLVCNDNKQSFNSFFRVEEYKRPTFEVTFEQPKNTFKLGQEVEIEGDAKAYAGYGIAGATVKYEVIRNTYFHWWNRWHPQVPGSEIAHGEVIADDNGHFKIKFEAQDVPTANPYNPLYLFHVKTTVSDITGETHEASTDVKISKIELLIDADIPEVIESGQKAQFPTKLINLAGKTQSGKINYTIEALMAPEQYLNDCPDADLYLSDSNQMIKQMPYFDWQNNKDFHQWKVLKSLRSGNISSSDSSALIIDDLKKFAEGYYKITLTTQDKEQNKIEKDFFILVYEQNSPKCAAYKPIFIEKIGKKTAKIGDVIHFSIGSYLKDAQILLEVASNDSLIESKWIKCSRGQFDYSYEVKEKDLGKIQVAAFIAQDGFQYGATETVVVENDKKYIDFDFITFRDKTLPGSKEQYQIRLKNKQGEGVAAELLCSMYDISLDALSNSTNSFNKNINYWHTIGYNFFKADNFAFYDNFNPAQTYFPTNHYYSIKYNNEFPVLQWRCNGYGMIYKSAPARSVRGVTCAMAGNNEASFDADATTSSQLVVLNVMYDKVGGEIEELSSLQEEKAQEAGPETQMIRSNFAETAFFYPQLKTDANGNIVISFTMPDALTRWKLQGFAHTKDLMQGYFCKFVETQKPLMVVPNVPRFFREGDEVSLSAKIVNLSKEKQEGIIQLTLTNALTGEALSIIEGDDNQTFTIEAGKSTEKHFVIRIPLGVGAITYRIEARNNNTPSYGDGEEATLPVLSNRILVKESLPISISGIGTKSFTFNKLKESLEDSQSTISTQSLTLDFTPNPIWYAIQSLPFLMEYPYECNEQIFSRLYANTLAQNILSSHPKIKENFEKWQNENLDAFCAQLEKNQELKSVILEETPWLLDAQNESQQRQNLALLFDFTRMSRECDKAAQQLQKAQNSDGGWSWFPGGESSTFITRHILAGCGHLKALGINSPMPKNTIEKALSFLDNEEKEYYDRWIKKDKSCEVDNIHYLYARSFFSDPKIPSACREAYDYFYSNLKQNWKKESYYSQAMAALIFYRNGEKKLAEEVISRLKSYAQYSEEMGMFWKKDGGGYFWYEAPIERQALMIEAFQTITHDEASVEKMQLWLLKQRQTQSWPTTKATTEACYALLLNNSQINNEKGVQLTLGDWHYEEGDGSTSAEAGSGYLKKTWAGNEVKSNMAELVVEKNTKGPAWGGLYWQYLENIDKVSHSDDHHLVIEKKLHKVKFNNEGEVLEAITEDSPLKIGDKVRVRIVIRSDRDMEYVHLKDMRASAFEPTNVLSGYRHQGGLWYYEATSDAATNFFIDYLPKGTYVFEYSLLTTMAGTFSNGITSLQCIYAPEFSSHSEGIRIKVK